MKGIIRFLCYVPVLLLLSTHRLPAPISEETPPAATSTAAKTKLKQKSEQNGSPDRQHAAVTSSEKSSIEATMRELENKLEASYTSHDSSVANLLLADDYVGVSSTGKVMSKASVVNGIKTDTDVFDSAVNENLDVRVNSATLAIVTGLAHEKGKSKNGKSFDRSFRFTDTWTKRNGQWRCTAAQAVLVSKR